MLIKLKSQNINCKSVYLLILMFNFIVFPCHSELIVHYQADGNALDSAGTNDGTLANNAGYAMGISGQAFDFDGINSFVQIIDNTVLDINIPLSITTWVRPESLGSIDGTTGIIWKGDSIGSVTGQSFALLWSNDEVAFRLGETSAFFQTSYQPLALNKFSHLAATFDGVEMKLFINGSLATSRNTVPMSIHNSFADMLIGSTTISPAFGGDPTRFYFDGQIDDVRIYTNILTDAEILSMYDLIFENDFE